MSIAAEMKVKTPLNNSHAAQNIITNLFNIHVTVLRGCLDFLRVRRAIYGKQLLQRDAMRKRGLCCRQVSVRPSVCQVGGLYSDG